MKYLLISPREPSGATWLINCLLELGIKTYRRQDPDWMWHRQDDGSYILNPEENILCKWLPVLSRKEKFIFRPEIEVEWLHEWPKKEFSQYKVIYFIRDPRDSIYSRYKRENPPLSFAEFINIPDPATLLDKINGWVLFNLYWLHFKNLKIIRFEDYKTDAAATLFSVLEYINIKVNDFDLQSALSESGFEKAREAEKKYKEENLADKELINRSSTSGEWKKIILNDEEHKIIIDRIEIKAEKVLKAFGYEIRNLSSNGEKATFYPNLLYLNFFNKLLFTPDEIIHHQESDFNNVSYLMKFLDSTNESEIAKFGFRDYELLAFYNSVIEFFHVLLNKQNKKIYLLNTNFSNNSIVENEMMVHAKNLNLAHQHNKYYGKMPEEIGYAHWKSIFLVLKKILKKIFS